MVLLVLTGKSFTGARMGVQTRTASAMQSVPLAPNIAPPANAASFIIDANHYYIQLNSGWTRVLLAGYSLLHVPIPGVDPPLQISAGHHRIMWQTSNHRMYSCTMTAPPSLIDSCDYNGPEQLQNGVAVWIITFPHFDDGN